MSSGTSPTTTNFAQRGNSLGGFVDWRWGLLAVWFAAGSLFLGRAIAGRFAHPLTSIGLVAVAAIAVVIALELRALLRGNMRTSLTQPSATRDWFAQFLPTLAAILLAIGFTVAGAHPTGLVLLWVMIAAEAIFGAGGPWTLPLLRGRLGREQAKGKTTLHDQLHDTIKQETLEEPLTDDPHPDDEESAAISELPWLWQEPAARQELRYIDLPEGGYYVSGSQRVTMPVAQSLAIVHTILHPPFDTIPQVAIDLQEPETVTIKAAQVLPHGIRWELRTDPAETPREIQWAFSATATTARNPKG